MVTFWTHSNAWKVSWTFSFSTPLYASISGFRSLLTCDLILSLTNLVSTLFSSMSLPLTTNWVEMISLRPGLEALMALIRLTS